MAAPMRLDVGLPAVSAVPVPDGVRAARVAAFWLVLAAKATGGWGVQWDIRWHVLIGRDSFWIAPHLLTYAGVTLTALLALGILARDTGRARRGQADPDVVRAAGLTGTPGWHLAWWGMVVTIAAAPLDDLWHRLFGIDVTVWSPPHLLGLAGAQVNTVGCMVIALELWPAGRRGRTLALIGAGTLLLGGFGFMVDPGMQTAFRRGGFFYFTWPILGALAFGFTLVLTARLAARRATPLLVALAMVVLHLAGLALSDLGFEILQPVPAVAEAIAADPDAPIAIAHEMARRDGREPGRVLFVRALPVLPAALLALLDARRRWAAASAAFGLALAAAAGTLFAWSRALAHARPDVLEVALGATAAALAGLAGGWLAVRLADRFRPEPGPRNPAPA
jgi:hypothetical protein